MPNVAHKLQSEPRVNRGTVNVCQQPQVNGPLENFLPRVNGLSSCLHMLPNVCFDMAPGDTIVSGLQPLKLILKGNEVEEMTSTRIK